MLRYALRRCYLAIIGLLLPTLPLFALVRVPVHNKNVCDLAGPTVLCDRNPPMALIRNGPLYAIWQTGLPPNDYWPIAVALLAAEGTILLVRSRQQP